MTAPIPVQLSSTDQDCKSAWKWRACWFATLAILFAWMTSFSQGQTFDHPTSLSLGLITAGYIEAETQLRDLLKEQRIDSSVQKDKQAKYVDALLLAVESPQKDRRRYLMPTRTRLLSNDLAEASTLRDPFPMELRSEKVRAAVGQLLAEVRSMADQLESGSEPALAYPIRWHEAMLQQVFTGTFESKQRRIPEPDSILEPHLAALSIPEIQTKSFVNHPKLLWPAGSYTVLKTANFEIASQAGSKPTQDIAELCEFAYAVWKLVFPTLWCNKQKSAPEFLESHNERFSVAIFRDKASYVKALKQQQSNIELSTGFYDPNRKLAIFYWDGAKTADTIVHELTHQFFYEAVRTPVQLNTDSGPGFWVVEGIAVYMESASIRTNFHGSIVDVGGWDSPRFQASRYRRLHDQYWQDWLEFANTDGKTFRSSKEIQAWYSQATGLAHFWMDTGWLPATRLTRYLESVYRGAPDLSLLELATDEAVRTRYDHFLRQPNEVGKRTFFPKRNEVVLSRCDVNSAHLLSWPEEGRKLKWLDLSFTNVDDTWLTLSRSNAKDKRDTWDITRLNLESTQITDSSVAMLAEMKGLADLDLSRTEITDKGVVAFTDNRSIRTLWLDGCKITDESLPIFASMFALEELHLSETQVSGRGWDLLLKKKPLLKRKSTGPTR